MTKYITSLILVFFTFFSCIGVAPTQEIQEVNELNDLAYGERYRSLEAFKTFALQAYNLSTDYDEGKAEACNNLGFYYFMNMDFEKSSAYYQKALRMTRNQLDLLIADIGMMKIAQRTAQNKLFYDYKNSAQHRMLQIKEDITVFDSMREKKKLNYAFSEYYIVSIIYYYYLQQIDQAKEVSTALSEYEKHSFLYDTNQTDISQLLYFKYIEVSTGLLPSTKSDKILVYYDQLTWIYKVALDYDLVYFQANALHAIANLMVQPQNFELLKKERAHTFSIFNVPVNDNFSIAVAEKSLALFKSYDDLYQIASVYVTLAKIDNYRGNFQNALNWLKEALFCVNLQHELFYPDHHSDIDQLQLYNHIDSYPLELKWIEEGVLTVPDWIARIREQLSVAYAGLNNKDASDYNRNVYLDILDLVRQDKEAESRFYTLQEEEHLVNGILSFLLILSLLLIVTFYYLNRRMKARTTLYLERLRRCLEIGQELTASLPLEAVDVEDILTPIVSILTPFLSKEFGVEAVQIKVGVLSDEDESHFYQSGSCGKDDNVHHYTFSLLLDEVMFEEGKIDIYVNHKISKEHLSIINLLIPSITWAIENGIYFINLGEEIDVLDKKLYITNQHNKQNREENIVKRATMRLVYGIQPYLDRVRNEIEKIALSSYAKAEDVRQYKLNYIDELIDTINEYNQVLSLWIKIKQGYLSLQIANFNLDELFTLVSKGDRAFAQKNIAYSVEPTTANVKADKALTLFMINTLLENARKYTPEGGEVSLFALEEKEYVEIVIEDTGVGLSQKEIDLILNEKLYDSAQIGQQHELVVQSKGGGFGLMNCKAIIDKYKKTNPIFSVCSFNITSAVGKGSKFSFRLPYGVKKVLTLLVFFLSLLNFTACAGNDITEKEKYRSNNDVVSFSKDSTLIQVSKLADEAFYANTKRNYKRALETIDDAFLLLNDYSLEHSPDTASVKRITLYGEGTPAEMFWYDRGLSLNYYLILDLRNEAAVASLALHKLDQYNFNNQAYTMLYKVLTQDDSLDRYCKILQQSTSNKRVALILLSIVIISALFGYYFLYIKRRYMRRWSLEQVLEIYEKIFSSSLAYTQNDGEEREEVSLVSVPTEVLKNSYQQLNNLISIDWIAIALFDKERGEFSYSSYPEKTADCDKLLIKESYESATSFKDNGVNYTPLIVNLQQNSIPIGVVIMKKRVLSSNLEDELYIQLIIKYLATVLYNTMVRTANRFREIEFIKNDIGRLDWENNQIHIQNKILDNCLSAIKHETIYYPSRVKQLIDEATKDGKLLDVESLKDLVDYYYGVFTTLSLWAKKELERVTFRRSTIEIKELARYVESYFKKRLKRSRLQGLTFSIVAYDPSIEIIGDRKLLFYLFELLIDDALELAKPGELKLEFMVDSEFINFSFTDNRINFSNLEVEQLFYPNLKWIQAEKEKGVSGQTFLIAKEIIREHDEYVGRRGCRIRAIALDCGYKLVFSIVRK